jgi:hypothetical protein
MTKIKYLAANEQEKQYAGFWCPGCEQMHYMGVGNTITDARRKWSFNFDDDKPVFGPSLLCRWGHHAHDRGTAADCKACQEVAAGVPEGQRLYTCGVCHSFIGCNGAQPGQIIFLGDSTHKLAGQTVDLPDVPTPKQIEMDYDDDERNSA